MPAAKIKKARVVKAELMPALEELPEHDVLLEEIDEDDDEPRALETHEHRTVRTWQVEKPITPEPEPEPQGPPAMPASLPYLPQVSEAIRPAEDQPFQDAPTVSEIDHILDEIGAQSATFALAVYRLTNYERDQRTDAKARIYCGQLSIPDAEYLRTEKYREEIQQRWCRAGKSNHFICQFKRNSRNSRYLPYVLSIEHPDDIEKPGAAPLAAAGAVDQLKQMLGLFREMREAGLIAGPQAAPAQLMPAPIAPEPSKELQLASVLLTDQTVMKTVLQSLKSQIVTEPAHVGLLDMIANLAQAPVVQNGVGSLLAGLGQLIGSFGAPSSPNGAGELMPVGQPPAPIAPEPPPRPLTSLDIFAAALRDQKQPAIFIQEMIDLEEKRDPLAIELLNLFADKNLDAQDVLDRLAREMPPIETLLNAPGAPEWISYCQTEAAAASAPE